MKATRPTAAATAGADGYCHPTIPLASVQKKYTACALAVFASLSGAALAQDAGPVEDEIRVTGTRIQRSAVETPVPVTRVNADELDKMTPGTLIEALTALPQFYDNIQPDQITGGQTGGGANLNLRGAGVNRSLILLEGRRVVPSNRFGTVDVSAFPEELVSRVETVTGGASASYGTDAVSGVVNFILDTDYSGFKLHSQAGSTANGDGESFEIGGAFGTDIGERMHIIGSLETYSSDAIDTFGALQDRSFYQQSARVTNPTAGGPAWIIRPYASPTNFTNGGIINEPGSALNKVEFLANGTYRVLPFSGVGALNSGCNCQAEPSQSYGVDSDEQIAPEYDRTSAFIHFDYDISDNLNFYLQGLFGNTENSDRRESIAVLGPWQARIYNNNFYLPQGIKDTMALENRQFVGFGFFGINGPQTPIGDARQVTDNELSSTTVGFRKNFARDGLLDGWELDGYYQYGNNVQDYKAENGIRVDRLFFALDAVAGPQGTPVCNIALVNPALFGDCAPVNLFGGVQNISPAAAAYIVDDGKTARQDTQQEVVEVVFTGDLGEGFGAGPISAAFGGSYRKEELWQKTLDPSDEFPAQVDGTLLSDLGIFPAGIRGLIPQGHASGFGIPGLRHVPGGFLGDANSSTVLFSSLREISGDFDVREIFSEFSIPLVSGKTLVQQLDVDLAARWADYSGSGSVQAWKFGLNWQATEAIRVRATRSQDTRAATLRERFDQTRGGVNVTDPANGGVTVTTASFSGGNPNVKPEEADTITVGLVFQPTGLAGFSMSADWYEIDLSDAINQLTGQNVVNGCYQGDQSLCQYVHRDPPVPPQTSGTIVRVDNLFINLDNQLISGTDIEFGYTAGLGNGTLGWRLFATRLNENSIQNPGAPRDERAGQIGVPFSLPDYKVTTNVSYSTGGFDLFVQGRWIDEGILDRTLREGVGANTIDDNTVDSAFYTDLNASYTISGQREWEIFLNVTNLFDEEPPLAAQIVGRTGTQEFNTALHDVLGRRFAVGFRLDL